MITAAQYISDRQGIPYSNDLNCWELTRLTQKDLFGRDLPVVALDGESEMLALARAFAGNPERRNWRTTAVAEHGAIAMMSRPGKITAIHCGTYLDVDCGGIFHTDRDHGVSFDSLLEVAMRNWVTEFYVPR